MKCPKCGHENPDECRFCMSCGTSLTENRTEENQIPVMPNFDPANPYAAPSPRKQPSRFGRAVRAIVAVLLFIALLFISQSCVMSGFMTSAMMSDGMAAAAANGFDFLTQDYINGLVEKVLENMVLILLISNLVTMLIICLIFRLRGRKPTEEFALYFVNPRRLAEFALFGTATNIFISVTMSFLPLPESALESFQTAYSALYGSNIVLEIFSVAVVGPILEEIIFRGIAMTRLEPAIGPRAAVIVSALLFGLAHGTPIAIGYAFFVGLMLALIYERCHSILPTIVFHIFFNLTSYWLPEQNEILLTVLYVVSILLLAVLLYSTIVRYPRFDDVLYDTAGRIRGRDPEGQRLIDECRRVRNAGGDNFDELQKLAEDWEAYEKEKKKTKGK